MMFSVRHKQIVVVAFSSLCDGIEELEDWAPNCFSFGDTDMTLVTADNFLSAVKQELGEEACKEVRRAFMECADYTDGGYPEYIDLES